MHISSWFTKLPNNIMKERLVKEHALIFCRNLKSGEGFQASMWKCGAKPWVCYW